MIKFVLIFIFSSQVIAGSCLETTAMDIKAKQLFKFESACQKSLNNCKQIFDASFLANTNIPSLNSLENYHCKVDKEYKSMGEGLALSLGLKSIIDLRGLTSSQILDVIDFYHHTDLHIKRVGFLAEHLYKTFPHLFKDISLDELRFAISFHDIEKVDPTFKSSRGAPFIIELYQNFAGSGDRVLINELNKTGKDFLFEKLKEKGFTEKMIRAFEILETVADIVDRTETPESVQEFMREMIKESERPNLNNAKKWNISEKDYLAMFKYLEETHANIIPDNLKYKRPSKKQRLAIIEKLFVEPLMEQRGKNKVPALLINKLARSHAKSIQKNPSLSRGLLKNPLASSSRTAATLLSNPLIDGILLATYSPSTGCQTLGSHPWIKSNGKCLPVPGLSNEFLQRYVFNSYAISDPNTCQVMRENYQVNTRDTFNHQICDQDGIRLAQDHTKYLKAKFKDESLQKLTISGSLLKSFGGEIASSFIHSLKFNTDGNISEVCFYKGARGKSIATLPGLSKTYCTRDIKSVKDNYPIFFKEISSLNYKIFQVKNCCGGNKSFLNEDITCEQEALMITQN